MKRDFRLFLEDIIDSINKIEKYTKGITIEKFKTDDKTADAVIRNFEIIGEAAKNMPDQIRIKYPELPWKEMSGLRNILIHEYFGVDLSVVHKTIKEFLPDLKKNGFLFPSFSWRHT